MKLNNHIVAQICYKHINQNSIVETVGYNYTGYDDK